MNLIFKRMTASSLSIPREEDLPSSFFFVLFLFFGWIDGRNAAAMMMEYTSVPGSATLPDDVATDAVRLAASSISPSVVNEMYATSVEGLSCRNVGTPASGSVIRCRVSFVSRVPVSGRAPERVGCCPEELPRCKMPSIARKMLWDIYHPSPVAPEAAAAPSVKHTSSTSERAKQKKRVPAQKTEAKAKRGRPRKKDDSSGLPQAKKCRSEAVNPCSTIGNGASTPSKAEMSAETCCSVTNT